jgi:hypothetical protein
MLAAWADRRQFLESDMFLEFFERVDVANFEIASDAFSTFKVRHRAVVAAVGSALNRRVLALGCGKEHCWGRARLLGAHPTAKLQ